MTREKDPAEVVETIAQSIRVSQRGARRVRAHRFKELFGYQALSAQRRERIEHLMAEAGLVVQPSLEEAGRDDWLVMSMPAQAEVREAHPDPQPSAEWFEHMKSLRANTEREVEMHFASPLFRELGYQEEQEAAGFGIKVPQGSSRPRRVEADLVYFSDERHDPDKGEPLVIVECKQSIKDLKAAAGQVRSYALWVLPVYYVITDAETVSVWDFQGAIAPDIEVLRVNQAELDERFDDLYARLNPRAAALARQSKIGRLKASR
jgi:Type I restriction enzyme R protein N terminus (HSDR_N)